MNGPETVSQCCRWEFWALCTDFATGPLKITFSGGWSQNHIQCGMVRPPREHRFGSLSSAGLVGEFESRSGRECRWGE